MSIKEILLNGGGLLAILLTVVQIAPIKINPWSAIARLLGKSINADVLKELDDVKGDVKETRQTLDEHIRMDAERYAELIGEPYENAEG